MALSHSPEIHQVLLESTHEVLGKGQSGLLQPGEKAFWTELERLLTEQFGTLTGRGMAIRMGRSGFQTGLRRWGETLGFYSLDFRLMPFPRRVRFGLDQIARFLEERTSLQISIHEEPEHWIVEIRQTPSCTNPTSPVLCSLLMGMFQEFMQWLGSGRFFPVRETQCVAQGSPCCRFEISRKPLE